MSIAAYKRTIRESESPRQIETRVFSRITGRLAEFRPDFNAATTREARAALLAGGLRAALADNRKLWATLRDDLAHENNSLPPNLRAQLLSIALWVDRQTLTLMGGGPGLSGLIDVNTNILAGLSRAPSSQQVGTDEPQTHLETL
ncbi:flagellar biosynthesis regulator FlaF [Pseudooceanicola aestuarii]|uniref:flagellar biosynthesis regulator FlaF n=1 Tax=Pseudooceanicola aestuarii TaxID=2697319 RepID=UPI0013D43558|nr:flagellar biosynthesis regulator FlaF [Pseudooceanicola aestuarii]